MKRCRSFGSLSDLKPIDYVFIVRGSFSITCNSQLYELSFQSLIKNKNNGKKKSRKEKCPDQGHIVVRKRSLIMYQRFLGTHGVYFKIRVCTKRSDGTL